MSRRKPREDRTALLSRVLRGTRAAGRKSRGAWRRVPRSSRPLLFALLLTGLLLVLRHLGPGLVPTVANTFPTSSLFETEPVIRVRIARLDAGRSLGFGARRVDLVDATGARLSSARSLTFDGDRLRAGGRRLRLPVTVRPTDGSPLDFGRRTYAGHFVVFADERVAHVVNHVPLETYLLGVVLAEMGAGAPMEALKCQAVASRAYALHRHRSRRSRAWDVTDDQFSQVYVGLPERRERAELAVRSTNALVMIHDDELLEALYSSTCGGHTRSADEAFGSEGKNPLIGVACTDCAASPTYRWTAEASLASLGRKLGLPGALRRVAGHELLDSGRLRSLTLATAGGERVVSARKLKRAVGSAMRSTWVSRVGVTGGKLTVAGRGFGHGVGLCQYGARGKAAEGWKFDRILTAYFPMAHLARAFPEEPDA